MVERNARVTRADVHAVAGTHFEMKVRRVVAVRRADRADFSTTGDERADGYLDFVQMRIHRVQHPAIRGFVGDHHQFPPPRRRLTGVEDEAVRR